MMKSSKLLPLLMAGLLLTAPLFAACGDRPEAVTDDGGSADSALNPAQVYDTLLQAEDFVFINVMDRKVTGATVTMTYMLEKDGNVIRYSVAQDAEDDTYDASTVIYYDLGKNICLAPSGESWYVLEESEDISIAALIENCTLTKLLFDSDHYSVSGGKYTMLKESILTAIDSTTATVSGQMTADGDTYTFQVVTKEAGNTVTMTTKVIFRKVGVAMPTYDSEQSPSSGSPLPDDTPEASDEGGNAQ